MIRSTWTCAATLTNALAREENAPAARRGCAAIARSGCAPSDFEVFRTEKLTRTSTVLLVDMSRSMLLRGCFLAAKKVAVALDTLIRTQFPHDHLAVIGFAYYAREIRPGALAELTWHGYEYGTNLQHGLLLARRILERNPSVNKEIVVITDGEPTAHFEDGQVEFNYPPTRRTIQRDAPRGAALHKRGHHDQHVHAGAVASAGRVRRAHDPAQPRPCLLRDARAAGRVRAGGLRGATDEAGLVVGSARPGRGRLRAPRPDRLSVERRVTGDNSCFAGTTARDLCAFRQVSSRPRRRMWLPDVFSTSRAAAKHKWSTARDRGLEQH